MTDYYEKVLKYLEEGSACELMPLTQEEKDNRVVKVRLRGAIRHVNIEAFVDFGEEDEE